MAMVPRWELSREGEALYQEIVENAIVVTGARFVNLSWYDPAENAIVGSAWSIRPRSSLDDAMRAAQAVVPGFNPLQVRFSADVNPAVHHVLVEGRALLAPFGEHAAGTVPPAMIHIARTVLGLRWTHSVPLRIGSSVVGSLAYHFLDHPAPRTLTIAEAFAQQAALTLENAGLSDALRKRAQELEGSRDRTAVAEERVRREIAELLHGRVETRMLVATQRVLECRELASVDPARASALLAEVGDEFDRIRDEDVRRASHRLHPSAIAVGLIPALQLLAESLEQRLDVTVTATAAAAELDNIARNALSDPLRVGVYRFVEHALANAAQHSGAAAAHVEVDVDGDFALAVSVTDHGHGFDASSTREGSGLRSMRDDVERLGGTLRLTSARGVGTTLVASVPTGGPGRGGERRRWIRRPTATLSARHTLGESDSLFQQIVEDAVAVTGARFVSLSQYEATTQIHELRAVAPLRSLGHVLAAAQALVPDFDPLRIRFPGDVNPATRAVLLEGRPLLALLTEHAEGTVHPGVLRAASAVLGIRWTHSVPLRVGGTVAGALAFHFADRPLADKLPVAEAFAKQVALTLENARLSDALRARAEELGRSRERIVAAEQRTRREIAELLHGQVQTRLLVATYRLLECRPLLESDPERARAALAEIATEFDRIREEDLRQASRQLHPSAIAVGLVAALQQLAESLGPRLDVTVQVADPVTALDHPRRNRLPEAVRLGVYRFVEEALANVVRHAGVGAATVCLDLDGEMGIRAAVFDGGRGFEPDDVQAGVGLRSMRDRIERLGGSLLIESAPRSGTTLTATLPIGRVA